MGAAPGTVECLSAPLIAARGIEYQGQPFYKEGKRYLHAITSSTETDMHGTFFPVPSLHSMREQFMANRGVTVFLNHDYTVPESVFGRVVSSAVVQRGAHHDLEVVTEVADNPRAQEAVSQMDNGIMLGMSVGFVPTAVTFCDGETRAPLKDGEYRDGMVISVDRVMLMETSVVGVPSNRRSWALDTRAVETLREGGISMATKRKAPLAEEEVKVPQSQFAEPTAGEVKVPQYEPISTAVSEVEAREIEALVDGALALKTREADSDDVPVTPQVSMGITEQRDLDGDEDAAGHAKLAHDHIAHQLSMPCCGLPACEGHRRGDSMERRTLALSAKQLTAAHDHIATAFGMDCSPESKEQRLLKTPGDAQPANAPEPPGATTASAEEEITVRAITRVAEAVRGQLQEVTKELQALRTEKEAFEKLVRAAAAVPFTPLTGNPIQERRESIRRVENFTPDQIAHLSDEELLSYVRGGK